MRVIVLLRYSFLRYVDVDGKSKSGKRVSHRCKGGGGANVLTVSCDDVPRRRIERYGCQRNEEGCFGRVDEGTEKHDCNVLVEDTEPHTPCCTAENFTYNT